MEPSQWIRRLCFGVIICGFWIIPDTFAKDIVEGDLQLNVSKSFIEFKVHDTLYLKCSGPSPLLWGYTNPANPEALDYKNKILEIEAEHEVETNSFGNETIIRLTFDSEENTGRYMCYHFQLNVSLYIFVDGDEELLLPIFGTTFPFILFRPGVADIIPCLPTVYGANVTLWKVIASGKENVPLEFNPTTGFILNNPTDYYQKSFMCVAKYQDRQSTIHLDLETIRETESIPQVYIHDNNAKYVLVGDPILLVCIVQTELNTMVTLNWTYPVKAMRRVILKDLSIMKSNAYKNITKELFIPEAEKSDEGIYQCNATDHSNKENYAEIYVKVYETPQKPKVYFSPDNEVIIMEENDTVKLVAEYEVFPYSSNIKSLWTKDSQPIVPTFKKYSIKHTETAFSLEIFKLSWKDSGLYTITVDASGGLNEKSFFLRVRDEPVVIIENSSICCYRPDQNFTIVCKSFAYPPAELSWSWKPYCMNFSMDCNSSEEFNIWQEIQEVNNPNNSTIIVESSEDNIVSYLSVVANESGFYKCQSKNDIGITEEEITFIVTDAKDGFEIVYDNAFPAVNTLFSAECKASSVLYSDLFWKWIPVYDNESVLLRDSQLGYRYTTNSIYLNLEVEDITTKQTGAYICVARLRNNLNVEEKSIFVDVQDNIATVKEDSRPDISVLLMASFIGFAFFITMLLYIIMVFKKKNSMRVIHDFNRQLFQEGQMALFDPNLPLDDQVDLLPYDEKWEFPKEKLKLGRTVGQGAFGRVVKADAFGINDYETSTTVAVKMLKERSNTNQQKALMDELKILIHLGHHLNIVNLMGAVTKTISKGEFMVIVEYCRYGNIRHYLQRHRDSFVNETDPVTGKVLPLTSQFIDGSTIGLLSNRETHHSSGSSSSGVFAIDNPNYRQVCGRNMINTNPRGSTTSQTLVYSTSGSSGSGSVFQNYCRVDSQEHVITTSDLLCYAFQCARGMEYLNSKKLIHRDLAARNVLLADEKTVKICDFGLAKDCYKYSNYIKKGDGPLPIKWMSIESIWDNIYTTKSDIWSFGILMWEFFTLGGNPYPGIDINEEFYKKLKAGYRMEKPELCPYFAYEIMKDCWNADPNDRPHFSQITERLGNFLEEGVKQHYIDLNAPYMEMNLKMHAPNYSNIESLKYEEEEKIYVNSEITKNINEYDFPKVNRSISSTQIPIEPMEVVPMIQLETIPEASSEVNIRKNSPELLQVTL